MIALLVIALALFAFGLWVAHTWDEATDYRRHWNAEADGLEDAEATEGTGSFS